MKFMHNILIAVFLILGSGSLHSAESSRTADSLSQVGTLGFEVAKGNVPGHSIEIKFGDSETMTTAERTIWGLNVDDNYFPASASVLKVTSTDVDDTSAGTGARTVRITYLDENYDSATEEVALTGQTEVTTAAEMLRVNRIEVVTAGSTGWNEGTIYVFQGTSTLGVPDDLTKIVNGVTIDHNQTVSSFYTVPNNNTACIMWGKAGAAANKTITIKFRVKSNGVFKTKFDFDVTNQLTDFDFQFTPLCLPEHTDMRVTGALDTGTGRASATWGMILIDDARL